MLKGLANKAVDEEVDTRVYNACKMGNMNKTANKYGGHEVVSVIPASNNIFNVKKLVDVNNNSRDEKHEEDGDNNEKNEVEVDLFLQLSFRSESLYFDISYR